MRVLEPEVVDVVAAEADDDLAAEDVAHVHAAERERAVAEVHEVGPQLGELRLEVLHDVDPLARLEQLGELREVRPCWSLLLRLQSTWMSQPRSSSPMNSCAKNVSENFGKWSVTSTRRGPEADWEEVAGASAGSDAPSAASPKSVPYSPSSTVSCRCSSSCRSPP